MIYTLVLAGGVLVVTCGIVLFSIPLLARWYSKQKNPYLYKESNRIYPTVAFFHPYCNAGGGGERVLWVAVQALQSRCPGITCIIFTGDIDTTPEKILLKARDRFNIKLNEPVKFVFLKNRRFVEARLYPVFTLLGQSLGSVILGFEALFNFVPDIYIDTMGYAFTVPIFRFFGSCMTCSYVHYPTISTDMLTKVSDKICSFNNASFISKSVVLTTVKLAYYKLFAYVYGLCGKCNGAVMVNSTWTYNHISSLWRCDSKTSIVYPPCDVAELMKIPIKVEENYITKYFVSIAQFRPEKDHALQIKSFSKFIHDFENDENKSNSDYRLVLVGSCRNDDDAARVASLRELAEELNISQNVEIKLNVNFDELKTLLSEATIGLHTMKDEHFGIGVVECMAAGTVVLAHNSGGPKLDIVIDHNHKRTGYLADSVETYYQSMHDICRLSVPERREICDTARESVVRFSDAEFKRKFVAVVETLIEMKMGDLGCSMVK